MAYIVIKTIKGHQYLYEQSTYREGGKVKTNSRYIGPVGSHSHVVGDGGNGNQGSKNEAVESATTQDSQNEQVDQTQPVQPSSKMRRAKPTLSSHPPLNFKINSDKLKISEKALNAEYQGVVKRWRSLGFDTSKMPEITIQYGKTIGHHKKAFRNAYGITIPETGKGNREKLRAEFRKTLARASLDLMTHQNPFLMDEVGFHFDKSYRATQHHLSQYLLNMKAPSIVKATKILSLKLFGAVNRFSGKNWRLQPESIGLVEYGRNKDWKDEFVSVYAHVKRYGYKKSLENANKQLTKALKEEKKAGETLKESKLWRSAKKQALRKAIAQRASQQEMVKKIELVSKLFSRRKV